ncbi:hypothetical protein EBU95_05325 [bacterium]|nr:hypothetical protein [bacterium]
MGINTTVPAALVDVNGTLRAAMGITTGSLNVTGGATILGNVTLGSNVVVDGPALKIPVGDVAARPSVPIQGYIRYNNEYNTFEGYGAGNAWGSLGGVEDIAILLKPPRSLQVQALESPMATCTFTLSTNNA